MSVQTTLHQAARDGNVELVKDILEGRNGQVKVSIDVVTTSGQTALHLAAKWGRIGVVRALVESGANLKLKDDRGKMPEDVADEATVQALVGKQSNVRLKEIETDRKHIQAEIRELSAQCAAGAISELELDDALLRMELDREWTRERDRVEVEEYVHQEEIEAEQLEDVVRYMRERPLEMQAERYRKGLVLMQKREKEEKRRAIEQARLDRIAAEEERRRKVKAREERHEQKELSRTRKCGKCGQEYTNATNRGGQCVHKGKWANWGTDAHGKKVEWLFYWTCCKSEQHEGPAGGHSICARSDPHEESSADIARRMAKERKKMAERAAKNKS